MVVDTAEHLNFYKTLGIGDRYAKAVGWLTSHDLAAMPDGRYEIDGKAVYASIMSYTTVAWEDAVYEAHEHHTDIQYIISGTEVMTYAPAGSLTPLGPCDPEKDAVLFDNSSPGLRVVRHPGEYMIFFPWDAHKPKAADGEPGRVRKAVVKILEK